MRFHHTSTNHSPTTVNHSAIQWVVDSAGLKSPIRVEFVYVVSVAAKAGIRITKQFIILAVFEPGVEGRIVTALLLLLDLLTWLGVYLKQVAVAGAVGSF